MTSRMSAEQREKVFEKLAGKFLPTPVQNVFQRKTALCSDTTAFQLRKNPNLTEARIDAMQELHDLPNFEDDLRNYFLGPGVRQDISLPFCSVDTWDCVRIQLKDLQDKEIVLPPLTSSCVTNP